MHWHRVFNRLADAAIKSGRDVPPPPVPLILNGWVYSNDIEKRERWRQTLAWAEKWGLAAIMEELTPDMMLRVEHPTSYAIGPSYGPMYLPWSFEAKPVVSNEDAERAVAILQPDWERIAGPDLYKITRPLRLTGTKKRRLVVNADPVATPGWGTWTRLSDGPDRREFTRLRDAVNAAIHPLSVDHIDFVHDHWTREP